MILISHSIRDNHPHIIESAYRLRVLSVLLFCVALTGCASKPAQFTQESFSIDSPYKSRLDSNSVIACESARRVLLGDGYIIDIYSQENIKGRRAYRSDSDRSTFIEMNIVCVDEPDGSMVYANGLLSTYDVKRSGGSASVGVSALGSVSLPFGQSADSMVKISDETIRDREFYSRFFNALNVVMARVRKASERAAQQAGSVFSRKQKQLGFSQEEDALADRPNPNPARPAASAELPPIQQVEPARTAEALEEAHTNRPHNDGAVMIPLQQVNEPRPPVESAVVPGSESTESIKPGPVPLEVAEPDPAPVEPTKPDATPAESAVVPESGSAKSIKPGPVPEEVAEPDPAPTEPTEPDSAASDGPGPAEVPAEQGDQPAVIKPDEPAGN